MILGRSGPYLSICCDVQKVVPDDGIPLLSLQVKLFRYPCVHKKAGAKEYGGHSSHVTSAQFCKEDKFVFTLGGNDRTVIQWTFKSQGNR